jgi:hypothetical protein
MAENPNKANLIAKILFIAGGIILFIVLVIFVFRVVPKAISGLSNLGSGVRGIFSSEEIKITTESDMVEVQTPTAVSFEYTPEKEGQYYVSYACADGLFFDIQSKDGPKRIVCDVPLKLGSSINSISLVPIFTESNTFVDSKISISYKDTTGKTLASGTKLITIAEDVNMDVADKTENPYTNNGTLAGSNVTTKPLEAVKPPVVSQPTTTYTTPVAVRSTKDLTITYISPIDSKSAFVMYVYNYGNTATGPWEFSYTDAENPSRTSLSPIQASLGGGQGLAITVGFDGQDNARQTINVMLDPSNRIVESNKTNNSKSVIISGNTNSKNNSGNSNNDADLIITSMEVGRISGSRFVKDDEIDEDDTAAVRFVVKNEGGESTGSWRFEIDNLPYDRNDTYKSKSYSSLRPGQSIEIVADFEGVDEGRYTLRIKVDSDDDVDEERENNNTKTETLEVSR